MSQDFRYSEEFPRWQERIARVWSTYEMGMRDTRILKDLLEPDDAERGAFVAQLHKAAANGFDPQLSCLFGQVAIAGLAADLALDEEPEEMGWMFMLIAGDAGWEPAQEILERYPERL